MDFDGKQLVSVPYSTEINDKPAFESFLRTADEFDVRESVMQGDE